MNRHAGPGSPSDAPSVPEPPYAERARTLVHLGRAGTLATLSRRHVGHPFASIMPYAVDERGNPLLLISTMAMHTQNLQGDARASLLVAQPDWAADALVTYARAFGGVEADEALMTGVDRLGFKLRVTHGGRRHSVRIAFPREVTTANDSRAVLIEMLQRARARSGT